MVRPRGRVPVDARLLVGRKQQLGNRNSVGNLCARVDDDDRDDDHTGNIDDRHPDHLIDVDIGLDVDLDVHNDDNAIDGHRAARDRSIGARSRHHRLSHGRPGRSARVVDRRHPRQRSEGSRDHSADPHDADAAGHRPVDHRQHQPRWAGQRHPRERERRRPEPQRLVQLELHPAVGGQRSIQRRSSGRPARDASARGLRQRDPAEHHDLLASRCQPSVTRGSASGDTEHVRSDRRVVDRRHTVHRGLHRHRDTVRQSCGEGRHRVHRRATRRRQR